MFADEAKTLLQLKNNPAVVNVIDFFSENGTAYLVMESGSGFSINSPFSEAVRWMEFLTA